MLVLPTPPFPLVTVMISGRNTGATGWRCFSFGLALKSCTGRITDSFFHITGNG